MSLRRGLQYLARSPTRKAVTEASLIAAGYPSAGSEEPETYARKLSAVDRCMSILAGSMAKLPNFVMDTNTRERLQHPILRLLNVRPNEAMVPSVRKEVLENSRNEGGNGYDWVVRDPSLNRFFADGKKLMLLNFSHKVLPAVYGNRHINVLYKT